MDRELLLRSMSLHPIATIAISIGATHRPPGAARLGPTGTVNRSGDLVRMMRTHIRGGYG